MFQVAAFVFLVMFLCDPLFARSEKELYSKAEAAWNEGQWEKAISYSDEALKINKRYKEAWLLKGQIHWQLKDYKNAARSFDEYLKYDSDNALVWVNRGATLFELKEYKEMETSFSMAQKISPEFPTLYKTMGVNFLLMGNYEDSQKAFQELERLGETSIYYEWTNRLLKIINENYAPPRDWNPVVSSYEIVLRLTDPSSTGYLVNLTSTVGTSFEFGGSSKNPFRYAPNLEVWDGFMIFDKRGAGLLMNGTHFRYKKISGDNMTVQEGVINNWRFDLSSKKCFLIKK